MSEIARIEALEARVRTVEQEVDGEKMLTRYVLEQVRRNGDEIAAVRSRLGEIDKRLDGMDKRLDGVESRLGRVEGKLDGLIRDLPITIAEVMRSVLKEVRV
jgi:archaellum component FlaC